MTRPTIHTILVKDFNPLERGETDKTDLSLVETKIAVLLKALFFIDITRTRSAARLS
jgi:hypothetical protein